MLLDIYQNEIVQNLFGIWPTVTGWCTKMYHQVGLHILTDFSKTKRGIDMRFGALCGGWVVLLRPVNQCYIIYSQRWIFLKNLENFGKMAQFYDLPLGLITYTVLVICKNFVEYNLKLHIWAIRKYHKNDLLWFYCTAMIFLSETRFWAKMFSRQITMRTRRLKFWVNTCLDKVHQLWFCQFFHYSRIWENWENVDFRENRDFFSP